MKILGRDVVAYQYAGTSLMDVHVRLNGSDCKREIDLEYKCSGNCRGSYVMVRVDTDRVIYQTALVQEHVIINKSILKRQSLTSLDDMKQLANRNGYRMKEQLLGYALYLDGMWVARYFRCGMFDDPWFSSQEARNSIDKIANSVKAIKAMAQESHLDQLLEDEYLAASLPDPKKHRIMANRLGSQAQQIVERLYRKHQEGQKA